MTLVLQEDAVAACTALVIEDWSDTPPGNVGPAYHIFLADGSLLNPAQLTVSYAGDDLAPPYRYEDLKLSQIQEGQWQVLSDSDASVADESVSGIVSQSGVFGTVPRVKLDVLFAMQSCTGMCDFHRVLAHYAPDWIRSLGNQIPLFDVQVAVVTRAAWNETTGFAAAGGATSSPPACQQSRYLSCSSHADCVAKLGTGWECQSFGSPDDNVNLNGSLNSRCIFRCLDTAACCGEFCATDACGNMPFCPSALCETEESGCPFECTSYGGTVGGISSCIAPPLTNGCLADTKTILAFSEVDNIDTLGTLRCNLQSGPSQSPLPMLGAVFASVIGTLDLTGHNKADATAFLRDDARLLVVFTADEDECSIAPEFASPSYQCESDQDCQNGLGQCRVDEYFSELTNHTVKLCSGIIKKDYYNACGLLEEYRGDEHHGCAYNLDCSDCTDDSDCPKGWYCKQDKKCRPELYSLSNIASYQSPPGSPIFSLLPVDTFKAQLEGLKPQPEHLLVGAIVGDGLVVADDAASYISQACLEHELLTDCQAYQEAKVDSSAACLADPAAMGCEDLHRAKLLCVRECYLASLGNPESPTIAKNTKMCIGPYGPASGGNRYVRLIESLGDRGSLTSYCDPEGIPLALARIEAMVLTAILGE